MLPDPGPHEGQFTIFVLPGRLAVCRLSADAHIPEWASGSELVSFMRTKDELTVVCGEDGVPAGIRVEKGWRALKVKGPLEFSLVGVLASLSEPLAGAGVGIFVLSSYDTDYVLVKEVDLCRANRALEGDGHTVKESE